MTNLNNQKERITNQEIIRQGKETDFWRLMVQALKDSKENIANKVKDKSFRGLPADQYKVESEIIYSKQELIDYLIELPDNLIEFLQNPDQSIEELDPYDRT